MWLTRVPSRLTIWAILRMDFLIDQNVQPHRCTDKSMNKIHSAIWSMLRRLCQEVKIQTIWWQQTATSVTNQLKLFQPWGMWVHYRQLLPKAQATKAYQRYQTLKTWRYSSSSSKSSNKARKTLSEDSTKQHRTASTTLLRLWFSQTCTRYRQYSRPDLTKSPRKITLKKSRSICSLLVAAIWMPKTREPTTIQALATAREATVMILS